ncbi:MAG TPA: PHB depolymerase family esterase, partial [Chitinophagaceae bacterium]|nr:PHB depolymerase family esterase [Chitinophagaceae bacterium]
MTNHSASAAGKCLLILFLYLASSILPASAQNLVQTPVYKEVNYAIGGYYESLPLDYKTTTKKYPLLIFIHGIGELGDGSAAELPRILKHGVPKLINRNLMPNSFTVGGVTSSFIYVSPQFRANYRDAAAVASLIDYCVAKYRVDESRIYLTGLSMGGGISWIYAGKSTANAKRLAALLVVAGNTNASSGGVANIASTNLPVWATHNSDDPVVPCSNSINWQKGLNAYSPAINPKALLNIFNSTSHDAWSKTYDPAFKPNGLNVYEWLLSHKRSSDAVPANKPPMSDAGADQVLELPNTSTMLIGSGKDADGTIVSYKWEKVSGPNGGEITRNENAITMAISLEKGTYTFRLTVKDNDGATD